MRPVETIPGMRGGGDKGEWWRGWIQVWYIWYILRIFVNAINNKNFSYVLLMCINLKCDKKYKKVF
jgi:hypothetical protein